MAKKKYVYIGEATPPVISWDAEGAKQWERELHSAYNRWRIVDWFWSLFGK
jgi:hypothetical protein